MPQITFIDHEGQQTRLEVPLGQSLMEVAVRSDLEGIVGECGGSMMCATCHVYVEPDQAGRLPEMSPTEDAMLDSTASERKPNSRLSCQLVCTEVFEGLVVTTPESQS